MSEMMIPANHHLAPELLLPTNETLPRCWSATGIFHFDGEWQCILPVENGWLAGLPWFSSNSCGLLVRHEQKATWQQWQANEKKRGVALPDNTLIATPLGDAHLLAGCGQGCHVTELFVTDFSGTVLSRQRVAPLLPVTANDSATGSTIAGIRRGKRVAYHCDAGLQIRCNNTRSSRSGKLAHQNILSQRHAIPAWLSVPANPQGIVLFLHGGPYAYVDESFVHSKRAQWGEQHVLCMPNLPGSTSYGEAWVEALDSDWMDTDWQTDMQAIIAFLQQHWPGLPLGIIGQSFGGYLALRAASAGMGDAWAALQPVVDFAEQARHPNAGNDVFLQVMDMNNPADPRLQHWQIPLHGLCDARHGLLVWSQRDEVIDSRLVTQWCKQLYEKKSQNFSWLQLRKSSHGNFIDADAKLLSAQLEAWLSRVSIHQHDG